MMMCIHNFENLSNKRTTTAEKLYMQKKVQMVAKNKALLLIILPMGIGQIFL